MDAVLHMTGSYQAQIAAMLSEPASPRNAAQLEPNTNGSVVSPSDASTRPAQAPHAARTSLAGAIRSFREGTRLSVSGGPTRSTQSVFRIALLASFALGGRPVCCAGVVPGVTLWISSGSTIKSRDFEEFDWDADGVWRKVQPELARWLGMRPAPPVAQMNLGKDLHMEFAHDSRHLTSEGAMQIEVLHPPAFVSAYMKKRGAQPLVEGTPTQEEIRSRHAVTMRRLLIEALEKSNETKRPEYARLPPAIRHRATGAIAAWRTLREHVKATFDRDLGAVLKGEPGRGLIEEVPGFTTYVLPYGTNCMPAQGLADIASMSAVWQAFEVRDGVFYEPTPALHRLLDAAYIADDVPIGMLALPTDTLCITPEPSNWNKPGGMEAIVLFREADSLSVVTLSRSPNEKHFEVMRWLNLSLEAPGKTILQVIDEGFRQSQVENEASRQHWRSALDYAAKMLLYLAVRDAHVVDDRAYTDAPRNLAGLGKRKRAERLAQIELLYDRHIVGPAILDAMPASGLGEGETHREVRGHWRRPHFKMQPHGPNASLRKLVFIGPTIVRPDRLGL
ncbi:hypothetical protein ACI2TD_21580 [Ralstonia nicotianae]